MDIGDERQRTVAVMTAILLSSQMETIGKGPKAQKEIAAAVEIAHGIWDAVKWHESEQAKKLAASAR
ncbi:MAG TPA: hypothetical protein VL382_10645 [Terriglobales bacterium]|nr:hypothetical protein [Terriglobales bacterium]